MACLTVSPLQKAREVGRYTVEIDLPDTRWGNWFPEKNTTCCALRQNDFARFPITKPTGLWKKRPPLEIKRTGIMNTVWPHGQPPLPHRLVPKAFVDDHLRHLNLNKTGFR